MWKENRKLEFLTKEELETKIEELKNQLAETTIEKYGLKLSIQRDELSKKEEMLVGKINKLMRKLLNLNTRILIIVGPSASGKSVFERNLISDYPNLFHKLQQVTTRKRRDDKDPYIFISKKAFNEKFNQILIGRTLIHGNYYGSIPDFQENKINTIILNEDGLKDFLQSINNEELIADFIIIGIDRKLEELKEDDYREGRDSNYIIKEKDILKKAHFIFNVENEVFPKPSDFIQILKETGIDWIR